MKKIAIVVLVVSIMPLAAKALNTSDSSDILSYVAMPLAVSSVCDVRGVQDDRVGELVSYMDQANVSPADFIDVFRYVPVALVMRTDGRPDFVEWVHGQVGRGVVGENLVSAMETQLRTYDNYVPVSTYPRHRRTAAEAYSYAYEPDYVPVLVRRHCERLMVDPFSLLDMPVAVADVYDLGMPVDRLSGLVVELNLGGVAPLQFVELMRYAPAALAVNGGYRGQPDFVQFVRTERINGMNGYSLVQAVDRQLQVYDVVPQIDPATVYGNQAYDRAYYVPAPVQNYVDPVSASYVPAVVHTRVATNFAAARATYNQPAPVVALAPQVQRLLSSPNGAVVTNPAQARRELSRANRSQREVRIAATPAPVAPPVAMPGRIAMPPARIENRGRGAAIARQPAIAAPAVASAPRGNGNGKGRGRVVAAPAALPAPMISSAPPGRQQGKGRGPAAAVVTPAAAGPSTARGHGKGNNMGNAAARVVVAPQAAAAPAAPVVNVAPAGKAHGRGGPQPATVAAAPAPSVPLAPASLPPGQAKKKGKGKD